jgi:hypothetical protein
MDIQLETRVENSSYDRVKKIFDLFEIIYYPFLENIIDKVFINLSTYEMNLSFFLFFFMI